MASIKKNEGSVSHLNQISYCTIFETNKHFYKLQKWLPAWLLAVKVILDKGMTKC